MTTTQILFGSDDKVFGELKVDRDFESFLRMERLRERLRVVHLMKLPLCGDCIDFHDKKRISCTDLQEVRDIEYGIFRRAIG